MVDKLIKIAKRLYHKTHPSYLIALNKAVSGCDTLLDVGCGAYSPVQYLSEKPYCTGVDAFQPSIDESRRKNIHHEYKKTVFNDLDKEFAENSYDCVLANDVIEHLHKEDGLKFLKDLERIAKKKVIIFTPNGFVPQEPFESNPWQVHYSGWTVEEMKHYGYSVKGINGWKALRGSKCEIILKPKKIWSMFSFFTQYITYYYPQKAYQIFCVKLMGTKD